LKRWAPTAIVVAVLAATAVAFATTERQKLEKTPFAVLHVEPAFSPKHGAATIDLRFRRAHLVTLQIIDSAGRVVAKLAQERRVERGDVQFQWRGKRVPDGVYQPEITLDDGREFTLPNQIRLDSVAPRIALVSYRPRILRRRDKPELTINYRVSEAAHAIVFLGRTRCALGYAKALQARLNCALKRHGRRLRPGRYRLQLAAIDLAGNVGPRTNVFMVRVR
jgi:hypothetical protein